MSTDLTTTASPSPPPKDSTSNATSASPDPPAHHARRTEKEVILASLDTTTMTTTTMTTTSTTSTTMTVSENDEDYVTPSLASFVETAGETLQKSRDDVMLSALTPHGASSSGMMHARGSEDSSHLADDLEGSIREDDEDRKLKSEIMERFKRGEAAVVDTPTVSQQEGTTPSVATSETSSKTRQKLDTLAQAGSKVLGQEEKHQQHHEVSDDDVSETSSRQGGHSHSSSSRRNKKKKKHSLSQWLHKGLSGNTTSKQHHDSGSHDTETEKWMRHEENHHGLSPDPVMAGSKKSPQSEPESTAQPVSPQMAAPQGWWFSGAADKSAAAESTQAGASSSNPEATAPGTAKQDASQEDIGAAQRNLGTVFESATGSTNRTRHLESAFNTALASMTNSSHGGKTSADEANGHDNHEAHDKKGSMMHMPKWMSAPKQFGKLGAFAASALRSPLGGKEKHHEDAEDPMDTVKLEREGSHQEYKVHELQQEASHQQYKTAFLQREGSQHEYKLERGKRDNHGSNSVEQQTTGESSEVATSSALGENRTVVEESVESIHTEAHVHETVTSVTTTSVLTSTTDASHTSETADRTGEAAAVEEDIEATNKSLNEPPGANGKIDDDRGTDAVSSSASAGIDGGSKGTAGESGEDSNACASPKTDAETHTEGTVHTVEEMIPSAAGGDREDGSGPEELGDTNGVDTIAHGGADEAGADEVEAGADEVEAGADEVEAGADEAGADEAGADEAGADEAGAADASERTDVDQLLDDLLDFSNQDDEGTPGESPVESHTTVESKDAGGKQLAVEPKEEEPASSGEMSSQGHEVAEDVAGDDSVEDDDVDEVDLLLDDLLDDTLGDETTHEDDATTSVVQAESSVHVSVSSRGAQSITPLVAATHTTPEVEVTFVGDVDEANATNLTTGEKSETVSSEKVRGRSTTKGGTSNRQVKSKAEIRSAPTASRRSTNVQLLKTPGSATATAILSGADESKKEQKSRGPRQPSTRNRVSGQHSSPVRSAERPKGSPKVATMKPRGRETRPRNSTESASRSIIASPGNADSDKPLQAPRTPRERGRSSEDRKVRTPQPERPMHRDRPVRSRSSGPHLATSSKARERSANSRRSLDDAKPASKLSEWKPRGPTVPHAPRLETMERLGNKYTMDGPKIWKQELALACTTSWLARQLRQPDEKPHLRHDGLTIPIAPKFQELNVRTLPQSSEDKEKEMMEYFNSHPFKASPLPKSHGSPITPSRVVQTRSTTVFEPFNLTPSHSSRPSPLRSPRKGSPAWR